VSLEDVFGEDLDEDVEEVDVESEVFEDVL
jgi:hypothetical protein